MRVHNGDIWQAREPLQKLMAERLPVKVHYRLAKLAKEINDHGRVIDQVRVGLVKQYGQTDERGTTTVDQDTPGWPLFVEDFEALLSEEVELEATRVMLPNENLDVDGNVLLSLLPFVGLEGEED